jgi:hypothetical protein
MRLGLIAIASALTMGCHLASASAQCDNTSQQNTADEAAVKGELEAGSKCAEPGAAARSEQKNEDAAVRAMRRTDEKSGTDGRSQRDQENPGRPDER